MDPIVFINVSLVIFLDMHCILDKVDELKIEITSFFLLF